MYVDLTPYLIETKRLFLIDPWLKIKHFQVVEKGNPKIRAVTTTKQGEMGSSTSCVHCESRELI